MYCKHILKNENLEIWKSLNENVQVISLERARTTWDDVIRLAKGLLGVGQLYK
jgi:hypothetical protein